MSEMNRDDPLSRISASELVSKDSIRAVVTFLQETNTEISESNILNELINQGLISRWQARSILKDGKYKGFVFNDYVFLRVYPARKDGERIAETLNRSTREFALLRISPRGTGVQIEYLLPMSADPTGPYPVLSTDAQIRQF